MYFENGDRLLDEASWVKLSGELVGHVLRALHILHITYSLLFKVL